MKRRTGDDVVGKDGQVCTRGNGESDGTRVFWLNLAGEENARCPAGRDGVDEEESFLVNVDRCEIGQYEEMRDERGGRTFSVYLVGISERRESIHELHTPSVPSRISSRLPVLTSTKKAPASPPVSPKVSATHSPRLSYLSTFKIVPVSFKTFVQLSNISHASSSFSPILTMGPIVG